MARICNVFHAGDGNIHPILLFDERDPDQVKRVLAASHEILEECVNAGGSVTGEHGIGVEKIDFMPRLFTPEDLNLMLRLRSAFNPDNRCSPAKMFPTAGACIGFLWWNAAPAKIFMGDTGSLALGGIIAGLWVTSRTEILAVVLGALFVAEVTSVVVQILAFQTTGRRVFRMAPFHHHFELGGWAETTVIIRFWLLTAISCGLGVALFYGEWLSTIGA